MCPERLKTNDLYAPHWWLSITDTALGDKFHPTL